MTTEADIAEAIRSADTPLRPVGGTTRHMPDGPSLDLSDHAGIALYEPGALTLVAKAGTPLAEVEEALSAKKQRLAFEPHDLRPLLGTSGEPTVGGMVATNASGPRRVQAGACRDFLLGVRFVTGEGEVVKNGGRVMKNVTGYDLCKLMCGSEGTLGAITEAAFKVLPEPAASATLSLDGLDPTRAIEAMSDTLGSPFEVSGAAYDGARAHLRIEGFTDSVAYRTERLKDRMARFGPVLVETDREASAALWRGIRDAEALASRAAVWRVHVRPSRAMAILDGLEPHDLLMDWGGGLLWIGTEGDAAAMHVALGTAAAGQGGHARLVKGPDLPRHPEAPAVAALSDGIRRRFDPRGVFA